MNNQCKNFRQRTKTVNKRKNVYLYCTKQRKIIQYSDCKGCPYKEYKKCTKFQENSAKQEKKSLKISKTVQKSKKMKRKTSKLAKLERERFSLFTDDLEHCYFCKKSKDNIHEVIFGKNRINSMKFGLTLPLCNYHHRLMHSDTDLINEYKRKGQVIFEKTYPNLNFKDIFGRNYIK